MIDDHEREDGRPEDAYPEDTYPEDAYPDYPEDASPDAEVSQTEADVEPKQPPWLRVGIGLLAVILILALVGPGLRNRFFTAPGPAAQAIAGLEQTAAAQPTDETAQYKLAAAYYQARRFDEAWAQFRKVASYRQAVQSRPEIPNLERAVQAAPESKEAHFKLGTAWAQAQLLAPAEVAFQQAIALDGRYVDALTNLGAVYYQMNRLDDALHEYDAALAVSPNDAAAHYDKGVVYVQKALQSSPPDEALLNQGTDELSRALEINPNLPQAHFSLGVVNMMRGKSQEAIAEFQRFLALDDGSDPEATTNAQSYLKQLQK
jgi:tetratricopeptide (TPR) repeat protein